jgi:putative lipoprotein
VAETKSISIAATTDEDLSLPSDAVIEVELLDVSRADAPSIRISSQRYRIEALPVSFRLPYEAAAIDQRMRYVVAARVLSGGDVLLRTTTAYPVLTRNAPESVEIMLERTGGRTPAPATGPRIAGVEWAASEIGGRALIAEDPPTIAFLEDGSFSLFGGCNRFRGKATLSGGRIAFGPIAGTRMACPPQRAKLEQSILVALESVVAYQRNGSTLNVMNEAGVVVARFNERPD